MIKIEKNKKKIFKLTTLGFTLIELLAVIVILAVIALIATPMILGVIETARKGAAESSVLGYLDAIEKQIMMNQLDSNRAEIVDGTYDLPMDGISVKGELPSEGWVTIEKGQVTNYSVKTMDYIVTKGIAVTKDGELASKPTESVIPEVSYICKRATNLHTEECNETDTSLYCSGAGYTTEGSKGTTTIEYGKLGEQGEELESGDALDCDVDGSGTYDEDERFYYVSNLDSDSNYAVLIYYNNVSKDDNGIVQADKTENSLIAYYSGSSENWHGPLTAITNLPTTSDWTNVSLSNTSRTITNEDDGLTTNNGSNTIENPFSYEGYAARLLTIPEVETACNITVGTIMLGELDTCNYLMENTIYSNSTMRTIGYWLENPFSNDTFNAWHITGGSKFVNYNSNVNTSIETIRLGIRPVIEVLKNNIEI